MSARLIYCEDNRCLPWAAEKIGIAKFRSDAKTIGLERDGELVAVSIYDTFSTTECNVHLASDGSKLWLNKEFLIAGFAYPFRQCGFESITGIVPADNEDALRFNRHIGWNDVGVRHRAAPGGKDIIIMEMLRSDCRFLPEEWRA